MKKHLSALLFCAGGFAGALTLTGCEENSDTLPSQSSVDAATPYARFSPPDQVIPFPNNLLFQGTIDGTLNLPVEDPTDYTDPFVALNTLDGFSTMAPITASMSAALDPASVIAGRTVRVFEVQLASLGGPVVAISRELAPNQEYAAGVSTLDASTLVITPVAPLAASTSYLITLSDGLEAAGGSSFGAELYYALAKGDDPLVVDGVSQFAGLSDENAQALEPLRQLTGAAESAVASFTVTNDATDSIADQARGDIILSWTFTTQSVGAALGTLAAAVTADTPATTATGMTTADANTALAGYADIHVGTVTVPYYLTAPSQDVPRAPLTKFWRGAANSFVTANNPQPVATGTQTIPLLLTLPNATSGQSRPASGWPVVIFQHGITQNRSNLLAIADSLAAAGFAGVAIDLPLHGITDTSDPLYTPYERTFDLDFVDAASQPIPDGVIDLSGTHFINLGNLLTTRDNLRQAVADLLALRASLANIPGLDGGRVHFVGHSLGAMAGTPFLAVDSQVDSAVLAMPGGGIAKLLDGSAEFGPVIAAGLGANGVVKGTSDYESFLMAAQTVIDTVDPLNHAAGAAQAHAMLLFEVVGGNSSPSDQVVPNNVWSAATEGTLPSPTAGTDPLAQAMGLTVYAQAQTGTTALDAWVRFNAGHHGSLLSPFDALGNPDPLSAQVCTEMQTQAAGFLASSGTILAITPGSTIVESVAIQ